MRCAQPTSQRDVHNLLDTVRGLLDGAQPTSQDAQSTRHDA
jgi:hypothetical protein